MRVGARSRVRAFVATHARAIVVFFIALTVSMLFVGRRLGQPSQHPHFVVMADGWLDGSLALSGKPPGWCGKDDRAQGRCKEHRYDDWAVVHTLELADGTSLQASRCRTPACDSRLRAARVQTWWVLGDRWREFEPREIVATHETWYVSFPPGPALMMLPAVALFHGRTPDVLLTCVFAALIPALLLAFLDRERGRSRENLWIVAAWALASPAIWLGAHGRVWFTAQICGALALVAYLDAAWNARRPALAGVCLALAIACRPINHLPAIAVFAWMWWTNGRRLGAALRFAMPLVMAAAAMMTLNWLRFADPLEFGHRYLDIRWQARIQETGLFAPAYLGRNLQCLLTLLPQLQPGLPWVHVSIHGMAIWLSSPWIVAFTWARDRFSGRGALALAAVGSAVPSLLYQNSGQVQYSYRFAADWLPLVLVSLAFGGAARRRAFAALVVIGALVSGWGAWWFDRAPGRLFVTQPIGWPFEAE